jgi:hypothetical protein
MVPRQGGFKLEAGHRPAGENPWRVKSVLHWGVGHPQTPGLCQQGLVLGPGPGSRTGTDLLMRSAVWMTLRERRSSFEIEGEADETDHIQRLHLSRWH